MCTQEERRRSRQWWSQQKSDNFKKKEKKKGLLLCLCLCSLLSPIYFNVSLLRICTNTFFVLHTTTTKEEITLTHH